MQPTTPSPGDRIALGPYWRLLAGCVVILAIYIATIILLNTETARRSTAPPWFSWVRYPPTRTRLQSLYLFFPAVAFAGWLVMVRRFLVRPFRDSILLPIAFVAVFAMNATTAMIDGGPKAIAKPFDWPGAEFFSDVPAVHGVGEFLRGYVQNLYHYSIHTRTHPPGAVLFLYFAKCLFGPGIAAAAWSAVAVTATGVIPFFLLARRIVGQQAAMIALALYAVAPSLVLFGATSMDGVVLVALLWSTYFLHRAISEPGVGIGLVTGISLSISLMVSYVTVCIGVMMLIYAVLELSGRRKAFWPMARSLGICAILPVICFVIIYAVCGFNYFVCLRSSRYYDHYIMRTNTIAFGRYLDISFCNLIAFLIGLGFPVVILWGKQTVGSVGIRRGWTDADRFNAAAVASVLIFSFARLFTHETERIWLFFIPPALLSAATWISRAGKRPLPLLEWAMGLMFVQTWVFQVLLFTLW